MTDHGAGSRRTAVQLAAAGGAVAAAGGLFVAAAPIWAVSLGAAAVWGLLRFVALRPFLRDAHAHSGPLGDPELDGEVVELRDAARTILALSERAADPVVRSRGARIVAGLGRILSHFAQDPGDVRESQRFLVVYVERAKAIFERYMQYESLDTPQAREVRAKVRDELLPVLIQLCDQHLQRITSDDLDSLDTDVEVLRKAIQLEAL